MGGVKRQYKEKNGVLERGAPVNPPSAMLNMNLCLVAFFFSSLTLTTGAAVAPSLVFSPFCSFVASSVFTPSFSSFSSELQVEVLIRERLRTSFHISTAPDATVCTFFFLPW